MTPPCPDGRGPLLLCAFDHRDFFERLVAEHAGFRLSPFATVALAKELVLEAALAVRGRVPADQRDGLGIFVDEQYGAHIAIRARSEGLVLAMPAERSGATAFWCEFGDRFAAHIETFEPHLIKVLVRYNPEDDPALLAGQLGRLADLSYWCRSTGRQLLFELLVPALPGQAGPGYVADSRPFLTVRALEELLAAGIRPAVWKLESPVDPSDYPRLLGVCRSADPDVRVVVLGGGASHQDTVEGIAASAAAGFDGFAIGRTIWSTALAGWLSGAAGREETITAMADIYESCVAAYRTGAAHRPAGVLG